MLGLLLLLDHVCSPVTLWACSNNSKRTGSGLGAMGWGFTAGSDLFENIYVRVCVCVCVCMCMHTALFAKLFLMPNVVMTYSFDQMSGTSFYRC